MKKITEIEYPASYKPEVVKLWLEARTKDLENLGATVPVIESLDNHRDDLRNSIKFIIEIVKLSEGGTFVGEYKLETKEALARETAKFIGLGNLFVREAQKNGLKTIIRGEDATMSGVYAARLGTQHEDEPNLEEAVFVNPLIAVVGASRLLNNL